MFLNDEFKPANERLKDEWKWRKDIQGNVLDFGVNFLDRALNGILPSDLILVGGSSGGGKTEFVTNVAMLNAFKGKKVYFFALEAEDSEIERRMKYKFLVREFDRDPDKPLKYMPNYTNWYMGKYEGAFKKYEDKLDLLAENMKTLNTFYRSSEFSIRDFKRHALMIANDADLIIVDHLHYFDLGTDNENREYTEIMKLIRDIALISRVPIILVAHIRKQGGDFKNRPLVPSMEDFQGTSNLFKVPTKCILLSSGGTFQPYNPADFDPNKFVTYFSIAKNRIEGSRTKYIGKTTFDASKNDYDLDFRIGELSKDRKSFMEITDKKKLPNWLKEE